MIEQIGIAIFGVSAIWFVGRREPWRRWGYICGLCSQPFWLVATWRAEQWGIFCLSLFYAYSWAQGVWNYWIRTDVEVAP
jgi:hypothetical protein